MTKALVSYRTYKTTNRWCYFDAYCYLLSIEHLLPSIIAFIMSWLYWLTFDPIETRTCGKAKRRNIVALFTVTRQKMMYHGKRFIAPTIHRFINQCSLAPYHHSPIIYLELKLSGKLYQRAGEPLMHSVLLFLLSFISGWFCCIDRHQHLSSLSVWLLCWPNQSGNIWQITNILLLWEYWILDGIVVLYIGFIICRTIILAVIWIIKVAIQL